MIFRAWLTILAMGICIWSVWIGLQNKIPAYDYAPFTFVFHMGAPWLLLLLAAKSWYRVFLWGRMLKARQSPQILSRGMEIQKHRHSNTFILSVSLQAAFLFALAGALNQLAVAYIEWWIASVFMFFYVLKIALKMGQ